MPMLAEMTKRMRMRMQKSQRCLTTTELAEADLSQPPPLDILWLQEQQRDQYAFFLTVALELFSLTHCSGTIFSLRKSICIKFSELQNLYVGQEYPKFILN